MGAQTELYAGSRGRIMAMDSAYDVGEHNRGRDVVVNASYCGVLPARVIAAQGPRGAIGIDLDARGADGRVVLVPPLRVDHGDEREGGGCVLT